MAGLEGKEEKVLTLCGSSQEREGRKRKGQERTNGTCEEIVGGPIGFPILVGGMAEVQEFY